MSDRRQFIVGAFGTVSGANAVLKDAVAQEAFEIVSADSALPSTNHDTGHYW
jgi:vacuolar-type H+-ATPase catalytic subunit A/Vma1